MAWEAAGSVSTTLFQNVFPFLISYYILLLNLIVDKFEIILIIFILKGQSATNTGALSDEKNSLAGLDLA